MDIIRYWQAVLNQNPEEIKTFFHENAYINWHNTNEHFNVDEFIKANCDYPDHWDGRVERLEVIENIIISIAHVWAIEKEISFHVTSFLQMDNDKILALDEYWSEDGTAPEWRRNLNIGTRIK